jgi:hypothetical protein
VSQTAVAGGPDLSAVANSVTTGGNPRWLFTITILMGSFLLFLVQPMIARMALPQLGGAPAVWNSAMLVYQALLLGGYAWAHWIGRFDIRRQLLLHGGLLVLAVVLSVFPIGLRALTPPSDNDVFFFVPILLLGSVGPLIFAVSAQAPLMQRWFADSAPGANPYSLYAASNLGSFGGLIAYPLLVEPNFRLITQSWSWSILYVGLVLLVIACGWAASKAVAARAHMRPVSGENDREITSAPRPTWKQIGLWIALSAVPSGLMLSTTTHLTTDIMAMPLMWALPLGLYLLSFSIAFSERTFLSEVFTMLAPPMLLLSGGLTMMSTGTGGLLIALSSLNMLLVVAVALHARLYRLRPATEHLTLFYLVMAVGGALGGLFCALIAPLLFDWVYEHPLLVIAAALLVPMVPLLPWADAVGMGEAQQRRVSWVLTALAVIIGIWLMRNWSGWFLRPELIAIFGLVLIGLLTIGWRLPFMAVLLSLLLGIGGLQTLDMSTTGDRVRSYFGVYTVRTHEDEGRRTLSHGTTLHGTQLRGRGRERFVTSYYGPSSGIGLALDRASILYGRDASIGVVGLGTGTLACYRAPGQRWQFFEIDPVMLNLARDTGKFTFMRTCAPGVPVHIGDARLTLADRDIVPESSIDILAVDAFSSDAIPLHLLTREAFDVYDRAVEDDGIVLVHISNRFVDLEPVLRALTTNGRGWHAMLRYDEPDQRDYALARTGSIWVAMARRQQPLTNLAQMTNGLPRGRGVWQELDVNRSARLWTDDYASVMPLLMWPGF